MPRADLHIHSTASDGRYSPAEIVHMAVSKGLTVIALSDHDTVDGIAPALEAAGEFPHLRLIPAVELSTDTSNGEVHVLGYFIDYTNREFKTSLERMRNSRVIRAEKMVAKLKELGCNIEWERIKTIAGGGALGRAHIAQALLEKGYIASFKEAFSKYIGHDCPAYVKREKLTPAEAVQLVLKADGLPVLAHPFTSTTPETMIKELKTVGLVGMEVYYAGYLPTEINTLLNMAQKYDLIPTGGTDYHGIDDASDITIGGTDIPMHFVEKLIALSEQEA
ncbi:MAG: PHP domain-containing protein [Dehalococcoidales bacterium]|nr:PHP domain-containing protein [Dehalococcoidales bacterium]